MTSIELPTFDGDSADSFLSLQAQGKHEAKFNKYVLPQTHKALAHLKGRDRACVRVTGLPFGMVTRNLKDYFKQFGTLVQVTVHKDPRNGKSNTFGYVYFEESEVARIAAKTMNNYLMCGSLLKCKVFVGRQVKPKFFAQADDDFHRRVNKSVERMNTFRSQRAEASLLFNRQKSAVKALQKLKGAVTAADLGLQTFADQEQKREVKSTKTSEILKKSREESLKEAMKVANLRKSKLMKRPTDIYKRKKVINSAAAAKNTKNAANKSVRGGSNLAKKIARNKTKAISVKKNSMATVITKTAEPKEKVVKEINDHVTPKSSKALKKVAKKVTDSIITKSAKTSGNIVKKSKKEVSKTVNEMNKTTKKSGAPTTKKTLNSVVNSKTVNEMKKTPKKLGVTTTKKTLDSAQVAVVTKQKTTKKSAGSNERRSSILKSPSNISTDKQVKSKSVQKKRSISFAIDNESLAEPLKKRTSKRKNMQ